MTRAELLELLLVERFGPVAVTAREHPDTPAQQWKRREAARRDWNEERGK
jgi:hypothetical protein